MTMNILHVATTLDRGGAEKHIIDLAQAQIKDGHKVAIAFLRRGTNYWADFMKAKGAIVLDLLLDKYFDLLPLYRLVKLISDFNPSIIHAHLQPAELYSRLALLLPGMPRIPFVITKHNDEPFYPGPEASLFGRWVAKRSAKVIAISEAVRQNTCIKDLGLSPAKVATIHYGIDTSSYRSITLEETARWRAEFGLSPRQILIGTAARFVPQKALHILISGFISFRQSSFCEIDAKLILIGRGPLEAELRQQAASSGFGKDIIFAGFREDIPIAMKSLDIFALTSNYEGFGQVLVEAMSAGLPVVASRVSSIPEIVIDGETGFLFESGDYLGVRDKLTMLQPDNVRRRMGEAGLRRVLQEFQPESVWLKTAEIYKHVLK